MDHEMVEELGEVMFLCAGVQVQQSCSQFWLHYARYDSKPGIL